MARLSAGDRSEFLAIHAIARRGLDSASLRQVVGERLRRHLGADVYAFLSLDSGTGLPVHAVTDWPHAMCAAAHDRALLSSPATDFVSRATQGRRVARVTDLVPRVQASRDPYLSGVLHAFGFEDEIQVTFAAQGRAWGNLHLTRRTGRGPFPVRSLGLLDAIVPHVTSALRTAAATAAQAAAPGAGVGVVVLGPAGGIELANEVAERLLRKPVPSGAPSFWVAVQVVSSLLQRSADAGGSLPALDVVDAERNERFRVRAERVQQSDGSTRSLVLIEPARTSDHLAALLTLGVTEREAEVALELLGGRGNKEIAAALSMSAHTVQTHLKHLFAKLRVSTRQELAAELTAHRRHTSPTT